MGLNLPQYINFTLFLYIVNNKFVTIKSCTTSSDLRISNVTWQALFVWICGWIFVLNMLVSNAQTRTKIYFITFIITTVWTTNQTAKATITRSVGFCIWQVIFLGNPNVAPEPWRALFVCHIIAPFIGYGYKCYNIYNNWMESTNSAILYYHMSYKIRES